MPDIEGLLIRWASAGILDAATMERIRVFESREKKPAGLRWQVLVALILGAILLGCGVVLFVSAHWDRMGPGARFSLVMAMVAVFHLGGAATGERFHGLSTTLHAVGTIATGAAIALVGQIFNIEAHWPAAVLLWALAAVAGWALLRDEAQQTLALLLAPAWIFSELEYASEQHIGQQVYLGRLLFVWAIFYLTIFLGSRKKIAAGVLATAAAIAAIAGIAMMVHGWSWSGTRDFLPFGTRVWAWAAIAGIPLVVAAFKGHKGLIPPAAALVAAIALPWCQGQHIWVHRPPQQPGGYGYTVHEPNVWAYLLVAGFAVFLAGWGVRQASRLLVNLGVVGFGIAVGWFYFSNVMDKFGRALGLICLGLLFLLGGWTLEAMRRRLIAGMTMKEAR